ncbi:dihydrofolate reductase family protein [bacterium]|nr:dihydrofolate reductase family protein [bacterium]
MERPRVIVHTVASVDGRVPPETGRPGSGEPDDPKWTRIWHPNGSREECMARLVAKFQPQVLLECCSLFVDEERPPRPLKPSTSKLTDLYRDFLPEEVMNAPDHKGWFAAVDSGGRLRDGMKEPPGWPGWRAIHIVSHSVQAEYLEFLHHERIPYLMAGERHVHLGRALKKLRSKLGAECVVCATCTKLPGHLLHSGLVDEISIVVLPTILGGPETPTVVRAEDLQEDERPFMLRLIGADPEDGGRVRLRYEVLGVQHPEIAEEALAAAGAK